MLGTVLCGVCGVLNVDVVRNGIQKILRDTSHDSDASEIIQS